jgi:hypothetical protein
MELEPSDLGKDEDLNHFKYVAEHKTNILPLRWFANGCNHLSSPALLRALNEEDSAEYYYGEISTIGKVWWKVYNFIDAPYRKWGTSYRVVFDDND